MKRKTPTGTIPQRKKSVSKASAERGREDSRAVQIKTDKYHRRMNAKGDPRGLAEVYADRSHDIDQVRKVKRKTKPTKAQAKQSSHGARTA